MITDQFGVFFDMEAAAAAGTSRAVNFSPWAGRDEGVNIALVLSGADPAAEILVKVEQSPDGGAFSEAGALALRGPASTFRLPGNVKERFVRLSYTFAGDPAGVKIFAGVVRDALAFYAKGQYIAHGKAVA